MVIAALALAALGWFVAVLQTAYLWSANRKNLRLARQLSEQDARIAALCQQLDGAKELAAGVLAGTYASVLRRYQSNWPEVRH